jgi:hypothetical protein
MHVHFVASSHQTCLTDAAPYSSSSVDLEEIGLIAKSRD